MKLTRWLALVALAAFLPAGSAQAWIPLDTCYGGVMTHWEEMEATYNNASFGVAWGIPGLQADVDYDSGTGVLSPAVTGAGWASMDVTSFVAGWHAGTYGNEGVVLKIHDPGHIYSYMEDYTNDITLRPRLAVTYTY